VLAYARSIKIGKLSGKIDMILPFAWLSGTAEFQGLPASREVSGFGDPRVSISVNFIGAPALPLSGFKNYKQNLVVGASLQENSRFGLTFALPVNIHHSMKLYMSTGVSTRTGSDFDAIGLAWQYRWCRDLKKVKNEFENIELSESNKNN
jgi:hypothetical protein